MEQIKLCENFKIDFALAIVSDLPDIYESINPLCRHPFCDKLRN